MYEAMNARADQFSGVIGVETDDLLGGGVGPKYEAAIDALRKIYKFGRWKILMDTPTEYGGRTLRQVKDFSSQINMARYLKEKIEEIKLAKGQAKIQMQRQMSLKFGTCEESQAS